MDEMTDFRAEEQEATKARSEVDEDAEMDAYCQRQDALQIALDAFGKSGACILDAKQIVKDAKIFEAYLKGEA